MAALWLGSLIWDRWHVPVVHWTHWYRQHHQLLSQLLSSLSGSSNWIRCASLSLCVCTVEGNSGGQLSPSAVLPNRIGMDPYRLHRLANWQFVKGQLIYWHTLRASSPSFFLLLTAPSLLSSLSLAYTPSNWMHTSSVALLIMAVVWASRQADKRFCLWAIR